MTQEERDRLVVLKKTKKGLMTQKEAGEELQVSERQIRRILRRLKADGDKSVIHGLKGKLSNRSLEEEERKRTLEILSDKRCHDFGPTYARDHVAKQGIEVSKETMRHWMIEGKLCAPAGGSQKRKCTCGGRGEAASGTWCNGTPQPTTGSKAGRASGFT